MKREEVLAIDSQKYQIASLDDHDQQDIQIGPFAAALIPSSPAVPPFR